jgi:hypothetical protein
MVFKVTIRILTVHPYYVKNTISHASIIDGIVTEIKDNVEKVNLLRELEYKGRKANRKRSKEAS